MLCLGGYGLSCGLSVGCGAGYFRSALRLLRWLVCCAVKGVCMINMVRGVVMRVYYSLSIYSPVAHTHTVVIDGLLTYLLL
jgi:hypothetical protein